MDAAQLKSAARSKIAEARAVADVATAADRDLSPAEATKIKALSAEAKSLAEQATAAAEGAELMAKLKALDGPQKPAGDPRRKAWSKAMLDATGNAKSINPTGAILVPTSFSGTPVAEGQPPATVRQLLPVTTLSGTDRFSYLAQTVRTNNAASVSPGSLKPTSVYSLERRDGKCSTIAHLSEPLNRADLTDAASLAAFVENELVYGVSQATEAQIVAGDGDDTPPRDNLTGFLEAEHTTAQTWDTDILTTTRTAVTVQQQLGNASTHWVLNPADWQSVELLVDEVGRPLVNQTNAPGDVAPRRLWSLPVVVSNAVPAGTGILGDFAGSAQLFVAEMAAISWSENTWRPDAISPGVGASDFQRNLLAARCEERVGLAITRPSAFSIIDMVAPAPSGGG